MANPNKPLPVAQLSDEEVVKQVFPNAECAWTSRGWRVLMLLEGDVVELGRSSSGHAPESEAWADARSKIPVAEAINEN